MHFAAYLATSQPVNVDAAAKIANVKRRELKKILKPSRFSLSLNFPIIGKLPV